MHRLKELKENLVSLAECALTCPEKINTCELGEVIDMIKDLEEGMMYHAKRKHIMGYEYCPKCETYHEDGHVCGGSDIVRHETKEVVTYPYAGCSYITRHEYMESKKAHHDKAMRMKELDKYMQELTQDMIEMLDGITPDEHQLLEKKMTTLTTKIASMGV